MVASVMRKKAEKKRTISIEVNILYQLTPFRPTTKKYLCQTLLQHWLYLIQPLAKLTVSLLLAADAHLAPMPLEFGHKTKTYIQTSFERCHKDSLAPHSLALYLVEFSSMRNCPVFTMIKLQKRENPRFPEGSAFVRKRSAPICRY